MTWWALEIICLIVGGCAEKKEPATQPSGFTDRALNDPFNYQPKMDKPDISGGGIGSFDKDGMQKDLDHVLNP